MVLYATHHLSVGYRQGKNVSVLLSNLNLTLNAGKLVALLGQNGAGKSTLLCTLTCDEKPIAGNIAVNGIDIANISQRERSRTIGLVSTDRIQAGALTVTELVELGRQPYTGIFGRLGKEDRKIVTEAIESVGITAKADSYVAQLSDGERQKAMIARALAQQTPIIMLDEPTAYLDAASRIETMKLLATLAHEQNKAILLSTHDISRSLLLCDELWIISHERNVLTGTTDQMLNSPAMNQVFSSQNIIFNPTHCDYETVEIRVK